MRERDPQKRTKKPIRPIFSKAKIESRDKLPEYLFRRKTHRASAIKEKIRAKNETDELSQRPIRNRIEKKTKKRGNAKIELMIGFNLSTVLRMRYPATKINKGERISKGSAPFRRRIPKNKTIRANGKKNWFFIMNKSIRSTVSEIRSGFLVGV